MTPRRKELEYELTTLREIEHFVFIQIYRRGTTYLDSEIKGITDFQ